MLDDRELLYTIASQYYQENLTQQEITERLHISRPMVSRALSKARELGIVHIEVMAPAGVSEREMRLAKKLGIGRVVIAPQTHAGTDTESRMQDIASYADKLIEEEIKNGMNVGIGWGNTIYRTVLSLPVLKDDQPKTTFVPLVGSLGQSESPYQVNVIVDRIAEKCKARALFFNTPAFIHGQQLLDYLLSDPQIKEIQAIWNHLDIAVVGLGSFLVEPSFPVNEYTTEALDRMRQEKVVGDILGRFFNAEGFVANEGLNDSLFRHEGKEKNETLYVGIPIDTYMKTKEIICLCGGRHKLAGIEQACKLGLITILVTDTSTAKELLEGEERI